MYGIHISFHVSEHGWQDPGGELSGDRGGHVGEGRGTWERWVEQSQLRRLTLLWGSILIWVGVMSPPLTPSFTSVCGENSPSYPRIHPL